MIKFLALLVMLLTLTPAHADDEKKYLKFAAELREKVWSDDDPMFKTARSSTVTLTCARRSSWQAALMPR